MKLRIEPQRYPTATGERPVSYAIYDGRIFLTYSWTLAGAEAAIKEILRGLEALLLRNEGQQP